MLNFLFSKTPLLFLVQSFWRDEAFSYFLAKKNILDILVITAKDFNPPLYYFILHFWMKLFGITEISLRSLSFIFYWATIYVAFLFLNQIFKFSTKKSFFYLILFIINPVLIYYAFEARMYTFLAFLASLSFFYFIKKDQKLYFISTILGLYTHYFMLFVILGQLVFNHLENKKKRNYKILRNKILLPLLFFLPWLLFVILRGQLFTSSFWIEKISPSATLTFLGALFTGYESWFGPLSIILVSFSLLLLIIVLASLTFFPKWENKKKGFYTLLFIWSIGIPLFIVVVSLVKPIFLVRYLIFSTVGLILFLIYVLENSNRLVRILMLVILIVVSLSYQIFQIKDRKKIDLRKSVGEIKTSMKKGDLLYVGSELDFFTAEYYLDENRVYIYNISYESIPNFVGKVLISKNKIATLLPFYPKKAFILEPNGRYQIQALF